MKAVYNTECFALSLQLSSPNKVIIFAYQKEAEAVSELEHKDKFTSCNCFGNVSGPSTGITRLQLKMHHSGNRFLRDVYCNLEIDGQERRNCHVCSI